MDNDQVWGVIIFLGIMGIILSFYGGYTLMEVTETPYDKCVDECYVYVNSDDEIYALEVGCISNCSVLAECGVNP